MSDSAKDKGFNDAELSDIINEIESLEEEFEAHGQGLDAFEEQSTQSNEELERELSSLEDSIEEDLRGSESEEAEAGNELDTVNSSNQNDDSGNMGDLFAEMSQIEDKNEGEPEVSESAEVESIASNKSPLEELVDSDANSVVTEMTENTPNNNSIQSVDECISAEGQDLDSILDEAAEVQSNSIESNSNIDQESIEESEESNATSELSQEITQADLEEKTIEGPKLKPEVSSSKAKDSISIDKLEELEKDLLSIETPDSSKIEDDDDDDDDDISLNDLASEIDQEFTNLENFESELDKNLEEEFSKQASTNDNSLEIVKEEVEKIVSDINDKQSDFQKNLQENKDYKTELQNEIENELKSTLSDLSSMEVDNVVPLGGSLMSSDINSREQSNTPAPEVKSVKTNIAQPSNSQGYSKMDFSVAGNMTMALGFHLDSQSIQITLNEENLIIELDHGATFSLPIKNSENKLKKVS